ncbi:MAG: HAD family phosphatase [Alphaproteobacteria bacterium]|nr:HAD family phosphatase [Alphaproteobacteria bacterium]
MRPTTVIFDMDDVLCRYDLGRRLRALSRLSGKTPRDIRAAIWDSGFEDEADSGGYPDPDDYLHEFGRRLGYPISADEWFAARRAAMTPWPGMLGLAREIGTKARIAIFTNNGPMAKAGLDRLFAEAAAIFRESYYSFEFATKKPDPASYRRLTARMGAEPQSCWFIDDKRSNVVGARMAGLAGHHFRSEEAFRREALEIGYLT